MIRARISMPHYNKKWTVQRNIFLQGFLKILKMKSFTIFSVSSCYLFNGLKKKKKTNLYEKEHKSYPYI